MHFNLPLRPLQMAIVFLTGSSVQAEKPKEIWLKNEFLGWIADIWTIEEWSANGKLVIKYKGQVLL